MRSEAVAKSIENAFGGLDPPSLEEMAAANCSLEDEFLRAVKSKKWQELRPLHQYVSNGGGIIVLSARAYQYYIPAFLYSLINEGSDDLYLSSVLNSLWYENWRTTIEKMKQLYYVPQGGVEEVIRSIGKEMPLLTYEERKMAAESRVSLAKKFAKVTEMTGCDWGDISHLRKRWEERMALLTDNQKRCIALSLVHILERPPHPHYASRIQNTLDKYWHAFLAEAGDR